MDPSELIDAQFEKAVSIIQSLPKTGPIQTGYEEKLAMYSLYKQATVGNVKAPRPGLWDMLGRAKWDAWAKHKDVTPHEAKWQYVDTLLKVLRKYSDKTIARELVRDLESYGGGLGGSFSHLSYRRASVSGSSGSESAAAASRVVGQRSNVDHNNTSEEDATDDDAGDLTAEGGETSEDDHDEHRPLPGAASQGDPSFRPPSSLSSHRYRTPLAGSTFSPVPIVPATQPLPGFTTPSAFGGSMSPAAVPSSSSASTFMAGPYPPSSTTYPPHLAHTSSTPLNRSPHHQSVPFNAIPQRNSTHPPGTLFSGQIDQRTPVERAVESVQAHIAALTERVEMLESMTGRRQVPTLSSSSLVPLGSSGSFLGASSGRTWDPSQMGLWSLIIAPLSRIVDSLRTLTHFIAYVPVEDAHHHIRDPRYRLSARGRGFSISTPVLLVVRRLLLDASFILTILGLTGWVWRKTGLRRKEVYVALGVLWRALVGSNAAPRNGRKMVDKAI